MDASQAVTAIISTSPIWCNPSTEILDETVAQLREHLPTAPIILLADGVHPEDVSLTEKYEEFKDCIRQKDWENFTMVEFSEWFHQSGMLRQTVGQIETPLVFWMEHDTPMCSGYIPWQEIIDTLLSNEAACIRFHLTGNKARALNFFHSRTGVPLDQVISHTAWPQIVRLDFFKELIATFETAKTYYDDGLRDGFLEHNKDRYRYCVYAPEGNPSRCYHTSGRTRNVPRHHATEMGKPYLENADGSHYYWAGVKYRPVRTDGL
jgi:hypothetical protein